MKVLIAGDFCPQLRVAKLFENEDFAPVFSEARDIVALADYSIVNYECPVTKGGENPIPKVGPNLCCSDKGTKAIRWAGFDCVTLANNHFLDYGKEGVINTIISCKENGLDTVGGGINLHDASAVLYKEINGETLAIINCCEHEFSIATEISAGSNPLNLVKQYYSIKEARHKADYVLVIVHGGHEHYQLPSPRMKDTYRFFIDAGADTVVNHHQHCFSGYEFYQGKPIFYGLGNFCFDNQHWRASNWNMGFLVCINTKNLRDFKMFPYTQCDEKTNVSFLTGSDLNHFLKDVEKLNQTIVNDDRLAQVYSEYLIKDYQYILMGFEPYCNSRINKSLYIRKILPSFLSRRRIYWLINFIGCESHYSKVVAALKQKLLVQK